MRKVIFKYWIDGGYWERYFEDDACFRVFKDKCQVVDYDDPEVRDTWEAYLEAETLVKAADRMLERLVGRR